MMTSPPPLLVAMETLITKVTGWHRKVLGGSVLSAEEHICTPSKPHRWLQHYLDVKHGTIVHSFLVAFGSLYKH